MSYRLSAAFAAATILLSSVVHAEEIIRFGNYQYHLDGEASWIKPAAMPDPLPSDTHIQGKDVRFYLVDDQVRMRKNGQSDHYFHMVAKVLNADGLDNLAQFSDAFDPSYQKFVLHRLSITHDGKQRDLLHANPLKLVHREEELNVGLYEGQVSTLFLFDGLKIGDIVDIAYTVEGSNPIFGSERFAYLSMQWSYDVDRFNTRLLDQGAGKLQLKVYNGDLKPTITQTPDGTEYQFPVHSVAGLKIEPEAPAWFNPRTRLQASHTAEWRDVAQWALPLFANDEPLSPELERLVETWKKQTSDKQQLAAKALQFVQDDIRYFGLELDVNAMKPFSPNEVVRRRWGDCKDKALLLVTLLRQFGIEAYPALVNTRALRRLHEFLPSAGAFDHAIAVAHLDGKTYWLDGTARGQHGTLDRIGYYDYGYALVVSPETRGLTQVTPANTPLADIQIEQRFQATKVNEPVNLTVTSRYLGQEAERMRRILDSNRDDYFKTTRNQYLRQYPGLSEAKPAEIQDDGIGNEIRVTEHYRISDFFENNLGFSKFIAVGSAIADFIEQPSVIDRKSPLALYYPLHLEQKQVFQIPGRKPLEDMEKQKTLVDDALSYRRNMSDDGNTLEITHRFDAKSDTLSAAMVPEHSKLLHKVDNALSLEISFPVNASENREQHLQSLIQGLIKKHKSPQGN